MKKSAIPRAALWGNLTTILVFLCIEFWMVLYANPAFSLNVRTFLLFVLYILTITVLGRYLIPYILQRQARAIFKGIWLLLLIPAHSLVIIAYGMAWNSIKRGTLIYSFPDLRVVSLILEHSCFLVILAFANAFWAEYLKDQKRISEQEKAEIKQLKELHLLRDLKERSQLSDHYVNNLLYRCYDLYRLCVPDGGKTILQIAQLVDYSFNVKNTHGYVPLTEELEQVERYVSLSIFMEGPHCFCECLFAPMDQFEGYGITPHLLLTLVENIFRHGLTTDPQTPASIRASVTDGILSFATHNHIGKSRADGGHHYGLGTIRQRLENEFEGHYSLNVIRAENYFSVILKLKLWN